MIGIDDSREALVIRDLFSGMFQVYPVQPKGCEDTVAAVQQFKGEYSIKRFYSDGAHEFRAMCRQLGITHEVSTPGASQNNGIIERTNQEVEIGTAACLLQAGLPRPFWTFAAPCYCHALNVNPWQGTSKWFKAFGTEFPGKKAALWMQGELQTREHEDARSRQVGSGARRRRFRRIPATAGIPLVK